VELLPLLELADERRLDVADEVFRRVTDVDLPVPFLRSVLAVTGVAVCALLTVLSVDISFSKRGRTDLISQSCEYWSCVRFLTAREGRTRVG
jgi:hypothetical protein